MKEFKPPKGQRVALQYFRTKSNGTKEILAIVTETNPPGSFSLSCRMAQPGKDQDQ